MGLIDAIVNQLKPADKKVVFSKSAKAMLAALGLHEKDAIDVFRNGGVIDEHRSRRKYNGYIISIWYFQDQKTGDFVVTSVRKW